MGNKNIKDYASKGGLNRAANMSKEELSLSARNAAKARWAKYRKRKAHVCTDMCKCKTCGRLKYKHTKINELCNKFICTIKGEI